MERSICCELKHDLAYNYDEYSSNTASSVLSFSSTAGNLLYAALFIFLFKLLVKKLEIHFGIIMKENTEITYSH